MATIRDGLRRGGPTSGRARRRRPRARLSRTATCWRASSPRSRTGAPTSTGATGCASRSRCSTPCGASGTAPRRAPVGHRLGPRRRSRSTTAWRSRRALGRAWLRPRPHRRGPDGARDRPEYRRGFLTALSDRVRTEARVPTLVGGHLTTLDDVNTIVGAGRADLCILDLPHSEVERDVTPPPKLEEGAAVSHMTELGDARLPRLEELLAGARKTVLLLPLGATEPHGPHAPLATDTLISLGICERAAERLADDPEVRVLVLPPLPYGVTRYGAAFPGARLDRGVDAPRARRRDREVARRAGVRADRARQQPPRAGAGAARSGRPSRSWEIGPPLRPDPASRAPRG